MTDRTHRRAISPRITDSIPVIAHLHDIGRTIYRLYCKCTGKEDKISAKSKARQWYHIHRASEDWTVDDNAYVMTCIAVAEYTPIADMNNRKAKKVLRKVIQRCFAENEIPPCLKACRKAECDDKAVLDPWRIYKRSMIRANCNHKLYVDVTDHPDDFVSAANDLYQQYWVKYRQYQSYPYYS